MLMQGHLSNINEGLLELGIVKGCHSTSEKHANLGNMRTRWKETDKKNTFEGSQKVA